MSMGRKDKFTAKQVIEAIEGSGGIVSTVAKRLGCHRDTAMRYIDNYATVKAAYDAEVETVGDAAESVIVRNIQLMMQQQKDAEGPVDSGDAKWYLSRVRRDKFATKQETDITSGGKPIFDMGDWKEKRKDRLADIEQLDDGEA